jgi:hypothetical protein
MWAAAWLLTVATWSLPYGFLGACLAATVVVGLLVWRLEFSQLAVATCCGLTVDGSMALTSLITYEAALFGSGPGWWALPLWLWLSFGLVVPMAAMSLYKCWLIVLTSVAPAYLAGARFGLLTLEQPRLACILLTVLYAIAVAILVKLRDRDQAKRAAAMTTDLSTRPTDAMSTSPSAPTQRMASS